MSGKAVGNRAGGASRMPSEVVAAIKPGLGRENNALLLSKSSIIRNGRFLQYVHEGAIINDSFQVAQPFSSSVRRGNEWKRDDGVTPVEGGYTVTVFEPTTRNSPAAIVLVVRNGDYSGRFIEFPIAVGRVLDASGVAEQLVERDVLIREYEQRGLPLPQEAVLDKNRPFNQSSAANYLSEAVLKLKARAAVDFSAQDEKRPIISPGILSSGRRISAILPSDLSGKVPVSTPASVESQAGLPQGKQLLTQPVLSA